MVWHSPAFKLHVLIAVSTVSDAMARYVVHFPPAIVIRLFSDTSMTWFREIDFVSFDDGSTTKGRIPLQAARISPRLTGKQSTAFIKEPIFKMKFLLKNSHGLKNYLKDLPVTIKR